MNISATKKSIIEGAIDATLTYVYGEAALAYQKKRYLDAIDAFEAIYGEREISLYTVAGRSELSGNHTDHNHGCVIAASIDLDVIAVASKRDDNTVRIKSEGFSDDTIDLTSYTTPREDDFGTSGSIIAGMAAGFLKNGHAVGGFDAYCTSNVLKGSGLSSSAAFEDMVGNILNYSYNDGKIDNVEIAMIAQYAENVFFGKPCGLMDQVACAVGGIVAIDFADPKAPVIDKVDFDMSANGYNLCIVNTGGNHADLTDDYAAVPAEMKSVAKLFGKEVLRGITADELTGGAAKIRAEVGDRALLRALHFVSENDRVTKQKAALLGGDLDAYFANVIASGRSSFCYLQNVYTTKNVFEQGLSTALCISERFLAEKRAAWRVHGGGFAGTIQCYVPTQYVEEYRALMDGVFGEGTCIVLRIRPVGATKIL